MVHKILGVLGLWVLIVSAAAAADPPGEARVHKTAEGATMPYRIYSPTPIKDGTSYPLVLCFHGSSGRGTENLAKGSLAYSVLTSKESQQAHPAFVLAPQCPSGKRWVNHHWGDGAYDSQKVAISDEMTLALTIVDAVIKEFPVDRTRIYVTGRSMGGFATWDAIARRPNFFAAAIPIAGGGDPGCAPKWVDLPIWAIASAGDKTCPVAGTSEVVAALRKVNGQVRYHEDPRKNHGEICNAWSDFPELGNWLFQNRRASGKVAK